MFGRSQGHRWGKRGTKDVVDHQYRSRRYLGTGADPLSMNTDHCRIDKLPSGHIQSRRTYYTSFLFLCLSAEEPENGVGICGMLLTGISWILVIVTLPFSLCVCFKVSWSDAFARNPVQCSSTLNNSKWGKSVSRTLYAGLNKIAVICLGMVHLSVLFSFLPPHVVYDFWKTRFYS